MTSQDWGTIAAAAGLIIHSLASGIVQIIRAVKQPVTTSTPKPPAQAPPKA